MVLHTLIIMGVHGLSVGKATLIVLIIPMFFVGLALLALVILSEGQALEGLFGFLEWLPGVRGKRNSN
jgi:hypothetical protein